MGKEMVAYCGLYCEACSFRLAALERDSAHLDGLPKRYDRAKKEPIETFELCPGCRQTENPGYCKMKDCAMEKGLETCADCPQMPCEKLTAFCCDGVAHHDTRANLARIHEIGTEAWADEQQAAWTDADGKRYSWYQKKG
jgi:hypothetical protein